MVNHFRTLLLNKPPVAGEGVSFGQYIKMDFQPISLDGVEESLHLALFGNKSTLISDRSRQEFVATMLFRLMLDFDSTRSIMEEIDTRLTFDPAEAMLVKIPDETRPNVPKISQIWRKIVSLSSFPALFNSSGQFSETLLELARLMGALKRDDHRVAVACCAYCLRLTEKLQ